MDDLKNIGLSANSNRLLEDLVEQEYFSNSLAAYQLAVTVAIIKKCEFDIDSIEDRQNKYGVSSFDGDAMFKKALPILYPKHAEVPYRCMQALADVGMPILHDHITINDMIDLKSLLDLDAT